MSGGSIRRRDERWTVANEVEQFDIEMAWAWATYFSESSRSCVGSCTSAFDRVLEGPDASRGTVGFGLPWAR